jgi:diguanylate cyclase (GGDEF)-like protein
MGPAPIRRFDAERKIATGLRTGWIALATFLGLIALSVALMIALEHAIEVADDLSRDDERQLVQRFLSRAMENEVGAEMGLINWDDAARHISAVGPARPGTQAPAPSADMAWLDREYGHYAWTTYSADRSFLVRPDGSLVRAWSNGEPDLAPRAWPGLQTPVRQLIARGMRAGQVVGVPTATVPLGTGSQAAPWPVDRTGLLLPRWAGGLVRVGGIIEMMTVASIIPDRDTTLVKGAPVWFVTTKPLDPGVTARMRRDLLLPDLGLSTHVGVGTSFGGTAYGGSNAIALDAVDGRSLGAIRWTAKSPGPTILRRASPMLWAWILLFPGVLIGGSAVLRSTLRTTRELLASEAQARHNALYDAMSGLPNRVHYMQRLRQDLAACVAGDLPGDVFVGYIDLDAFKLVNDTLGHHIGDELVRQVALRLRRMLPANDLVARFGGDEFVVLRHAEGGRSMADQLGRQIMAMLHEPFVVSGATIDVTCSCGISWGPAQSEDPGELLRRADIALYRAKQRGRSRYRCFTRDMDASVKLRLELEIELRRAIARDELSVAYQPIVGMSTSGHGHDGAILGVEALLRWQHPERGVIRPDLFVPIAEQGGLMIPLGNWMLRHVFAQCRDWPDCDISVNLSPIQIMAADFVATIAAIVDETGIDPRRVVMEITEGVMLDQSEHVLTVLREMNRMGFRIALDDFGKGYSSLSYLRLFQFERIKIDRAFVSNIEGDADGQAIMATIASLGHALHMKVVAEGVETEAQLALVRAAGCELAQGYLFWKPMPAHELLPLLRAKPEARSQRSA